MLVTWPVRAGAQQASPHEPPPAGDIAAPQPPAASEGEVPPPPAAEEAAPAQPTELTDAATPTEPTEAVPPGGPAEPADTAEPDETARRVEILTEEVERLRERLVLPETEESRSRFGLGPAASRVYGVERGLSIGGYGELHFQGIVSDRSEGETNVFDIPRVVLYAGYKFTPKILVNVELEFEHAKEAEVEFAYLDFLLHDAAAIRAGLVLLPVGLINEFHEPPFFNGNLRPLVERKIIPTTWRELGIGLVGEPIEGLSYRAYLITGMRATGFGPAGWAGGRQHARQAIGNDVAIVGRVDYEIVPQLVVGASGYYGGADQGEITTNDGAEVPVDTALVEAHARLRHRGLEVKALGAYGLVRNAAHVALNLDPDGTSTIGSRLAAAYGEVSYDVVSLLAADARFSVAPWVRVEWLDSQLAVPDLVGRPGDDGLNVTAVAAGVAVRPHANVVLKAEYVNQWNAAGSRMADSVFAGAGFIF